MMETTKDIRRLINDNRLEEAIGLLQERIGENSLDDEAYYLLGNVYRKMGNGKEATRCYLTAVEINPDSPAGEAYRSLTEIRDFVNPDYNP